MNIVKVLFVKKNLLKLGHMLTPSDGDDQKQFDANELDAFSMPSTASYVMIFSVSAVTIVIIIMCSKKTTEPPPSHQAHASVSLEKGPTIEEKSTLIITKDVDADLKDGETKQVEIIIVYGQDEKTRTKSILKKPSPSFIVNDDVEMPKLDGSESSTSLSSVS